jgi:hypothetical protein
MEDERLRFLQIARVETLSEPPVNLSQQFARLLHLALLAPKAAPCLLQPAAPRILFAGDARPRERD